MSTTPASDIRVDRWPSEMPLFALVLIASIALWIVAVVTIVGLVYGAIFGLFLFVMHLGFIAHVRGNGVRVGPSQFPEVHEAVERLAHRIGMKKIPEVYLIQGGGVLNAFATRFVGSDILVLYSDLIEACGDDTAARDMIIAHELGHVACGHVRWSFALAPSMIVPFLFSAYSRAREYTCDRYGLAGAGSAEGAVNGLTILATGGRLARRVDRQVFMSQHAALNTGFMTLGEWLSTHPPLVKRIAQVDPSLRDASHESTAGVLRALGIVGAVFAPFVIAGVLAAILVPVWFAGQAAALENADEADETAASEETSAPAATTEFKAPAADVGTKQAMQDFAALAAFIREEERAGRSLPWDTKEMYDRWNAKHPGEREPLDPFDGTRYVYQQRGTRFRLVSVGPDEEWETDDDLIYDSVTTGTIAAKGTQ